MPLSRSVPKKPRIQSKNSVATTAKRLLARKKHPPTMTLPTTPPTTPALPVVPGPPPAALPQPVAVSSASGSTPAPSNPSPVSPTTTVDPSASPAPAAATGATDPTASAPPTLVDPPPSASLPTPPAGFVEVNAREFLGFRPTVVQVAAAPVALSELQTASSYATDFGSYAPSAPSVAAALDTAYRWRMARGIVASYEAYARSMDALAWKNALTLLRQLETSFLAAAALNPAIPAKYPGLARTFDAAKLVAKTATATKKKNAKADAQKAATSAASTPAAAPANATPAAPAKGGATSA